MNWLAKISITCFAASYLVVLVVELLRVWMHRSTVRSTIKVGFAIAGFFAHTVFLAYQTNLTFDQSGLWLGSWFGWSLAGAWLLAAAYLWLVWQKFNSNVGLFILPIVLGLIGWGTWIGNETQFTAVREKSIWGMVHGISLLVGTVVVALGFVFGVMYLIHARRLKSKSVSSGQFRLPSLEWLHVNTERSLIVSACCLGLGLLSGIALNLTGTSDGIKIPWVNPVIWSSAALFGWLLFSCVGSKLYQPSRSGRKVAMLVLFSFLFLVIELGIAWIFGHGTGVSP
jgi:hypothetical protein